MEILRPAAEALAVNMTVESEIMTRLDFVRDTDAPRSFTFASDGDDDRRLQLLRLVCQFVWLHWPMSDKPS